MKNFIGRKTGNDKQSDETLLEQVKNVSISTKDYLNVYTNLVHANAYKNNNIKNVINYIPFVFNEEGEPIINKDSSEGNPFNKAGVNSVYRMTSKGQKSEEDFIPPSSIIELYNEDNTISEIINQKMISFSKGNIIPKINDKDPIYSSASDDTKEEFDKFIQAATDLLASNKTELKEIIEDTKWYPYRGIAYIPLSYSKSLEDNSIDERPNHRKIEITPFNSDFDITHSEKLHNSEFAVITEKIVYNQFKQRLLSGEYSLIDKKIKKDDAILKLWNKQSSYKFVTKNFPEQAITRNSDLREQSLNGIMKGSDNDSDVNIYGVIDYMFSKDIDGKFTVITYLNGDKIGETTVDKSIDIIPVVLFSESRNIYNNLQFNGNVGFKLLSPQNTIQVLNNLKKIATDDMAPIIINNYINNESELEESKDLTEISTAGNSITMASVQVKNTNQANNLARIQSGSVLYASYLNELDNLIEKAMYTMKIKSGITDFMDGTASHSFESASGLDSMKVAGLESELDIVESIKNSMIRFAITEAFFKMIELKNTDGVKDNKDKIDNSNIIAEPYRTNLTTAWKGYSDILKFEFETSYQKQLAQSMIQTTLIPLAAQSGQLHYVIDLLKELPITENLKTKITQIAQSMQEEKQKEQQQAQDIEAQKQVQAQQQMENSNNKQVKKNESTKTPTTKKNTKK